MKRKKRSLFLKVKAGVMVAWASREELSETLGDLRRSGVDVVTVGQSSSRTRSICAQ